MTRSRPDQLCEYSVGMAVSAIEIYNKPGFTNREAAFCILMSAAWEGLTKARLVQANGNDPRCLWTKKKNRWETNEYGDKKTKLIGEVIEKTIESSVVKDNIYKLLRLRNVCVHHMPRTRGLTQLVHVLATSTLDNYAHYAKEWFGVSMAKYNFFILPLGFEYPFTKLSAIDLSKEPGEVREIISSLIDAQKSGQHQDGDRTLLLEISVDMVSAKQSMREADYFTTITQEGADMIGPKIYMNFNDKYPYSHPVLCKKVLDKEPACTRKFVIQIINDHDIRNNPKLSGYGYADKDKERLGPKASFGSRYNSDTVQFIVSTFRQEHESKTTS